MARSTITLSKNTFNRFNKAAAAFEQTDSPIYNDNSLPHGGKNYWIGIIMDSGPAAEIDYPSDSGLYWVKKAYIDEALTITDPITFAEDDSLNSLWITATDLDNSRLAVGTIVMVSWGINQDGKIKYLIAPSFNKLIKAIVLSESTDDLSCYFPGGDSLTESFTVMKPIHLQGGIGKIAEKYIYPPYCSGDVIYVHNIKEGTEPDIIKYVDSHARTLDECPGTCSDGILWKYKKSCAVIGDLSASVDCPQNIYLIPDAEEAPALIQARLGDDCCKQTCCYFYVGESTGIKASCPVPLYTTIADCDDCSSKKCVKIVDCCDEDNYAIYSWDSLFAPDIINNFGDIRGKIIKIESASSTCWQVPTQPLTDEEIAADAEIAASCLQQISIGSTSGNALAEVFNTCLLCSTAYAKLTNCDEEYVEAEEYYVKWDDWVLANSLVAGSVIKLAAPPGCWTVGSKTLGCMPESITGFSAPIISGSPYESCELCDIKCVKLEACDGGGFITLNWDDVSAHASRIIKFGNSPTCYLVPATHSNTCNINDIIDLLTAGGTPVDAGNPACENCIQDTITLVDCSDPLNEYIVYWDWVKDYASKVIKIDNTGCESTCWQVPADHDAVASTVDEYITTVFESYDDCESCADVYNLTLCPINGISTGLTIVVKALGLSNLLGKTVKLSNGMCYSVVSINEAVDPAIICEVISEVYNECTECRPVELCVDACSGTNTALGVGTGASQALSEAAAILAAKAGAATACGSSQNLDYCSCGTILQSYEMTSEWQSIAYVCYKCICSDPEALSNAVIGRTGPAVYIEEVEVAINCDTVIPNHPDYVDCAEGFYATATGEYISNVELEMQEYADGATIVPSAGYTNSGQTGDYVASISGSCVFDDVTITGTIKFTALNMRLSNKKSCFVYNTAKICVDEVGQCNGTTVC